MNSYIKILISFTGFIFFNVVYSQNKINIDTLKKESFSKFHVTPGEKRVIFDTGEKTYIYTWKKKEGKNVVYRSDGSLCLKGEYRKNKNIGFWEFFDNENRLIYTYSYDKNELIYFYKTGVIKAKGKFKKGIKIGKWYFYYEDGTKKCVGKLSAFGKVGFWKYFENGGEKIKKTKYFKHQYFSIYKIINDEFDYFCSCIPDNPMIPED